MKVMCSVHDSCSGIYGDPFTTVNTASAIRGFSDAVNGSESDLTKHPEHFTLWHIGDYDPSTGFIVPVEAVCLVRAIDVKQEAM